MYLSKLAPVGGHDEDVVVDKDSNDQDYKSNRLKMEELNFFFLKKKETYPHKYKVVTLLTEERPEWH